SVPDGQCTVRIMQGLFFILFAPARCAFRYVVTARYCSETVLSEFDGAAAKEVKVGMVEVVRCVVAQCCTYGACTHVKVEFFIFKKSCRTMESMVVLSVEVTSERP